MAFNAFATSSRDRIDNYEANRRTEARTRELRGQTPGVAKKVQSTAKKAAGTPYPYASSQTPAPFDGPSVNLSMLDARQFT